MQDVHPSTIAVVVPGEPIGVPVSPQVVLGGGVYQHQDQVIATVTGPRRGNEQDRVWVSEARRRYMPQVGDVVVGIVTERMGAEGYVVDVAGPRLALLDALAFDGASKRNAPDLDVGALVFAQVIKAGGDVDPQISCQVLNMGTKKDWATGEATFGELADERGCMFEVPRATCRRLSTPACPLLDALAMWFAYEVVVGLNGRVWVCAEDVRHVVVIGNVLRAASGLNLDETGAMQLVKKCCKAAKLDKPRGGKGKIVRDGGGNTTTNNNTRNEMERQRDDEEDEREDSDVEMLMGEE